MSGRNRAVPASERVSQFTPLLPTTSRLRPENRFRSQSSFMRTKNLSEQIVSGSVMPFSRGRNWKSVTAPLRMNRSAGLSGGTSRRSGKTATRGSNRSGKFWSEHGYRVMGRPGVDTVSARPAAARWRRLASALWPATTLSTLRSTHLTSQRVRSSRRAASSGS